MIYTTPPSRLSCISILGLKSEKSLFGFHFIKQCYNVFTPKVAFELSWILECVHRNIKLVWISERFTHNCLFHYINLLKSVISNFISPDNPTKFGNQFNFLKPMISCTEFEQLKNFFQKWNHQVLIFRFINNSLYVNMFSGIY